MDFCLAICTYNRPQDLTRCLESVWMQSIRPSSLLVIDDGELGMDMVQEIERQASSLGVSFKYYKKDHSRERRGLAESKNLALELAKEEIVCFLDDDIVLYPDFFSSLMSLWQENISNEKLIGVGGVINNSRRISGLERGYNKLFGLSSALSWDITPQAFQVWDDYIKTPSRGHYAHGGLLSLRRSVATKLRFLEFSGGRTALEDVDFSGRAKNQGYYFIVTPHARADHHHSPMSRESFYLMGFKEGYNRCQMYYQTGKKSPSERLAFFRAQIGWIMRQFLAGHLVTGWGMLRGWISYCKGN